MITTIVNITLGILVASIAVLVTIVIIFLIILGIQDLFF